jgi:hypothetical protein
LQVVRVHVILEGTLRWPRAEAAQTNPFPLNHGTELPNVEKFPKRVRERERPRERERDRERENECAENFKQEKVNILVSSPVFQFPSRVKERKNESK